ncbi:MAG: CRTAC1 family protein [Pirellulales bacterium]
MTQAQLFLLRGAFVVAILLSGLNCRPTSVVDGRNESRPVPEAMPAAPAWLIDVAAKGNVDFAYRNGEEADRYTILESLGGGVCLLDYDQDGRIDIFITGGGSLPSEGPAMPAGRAGKLYRNRGDWSFEDVTRLLGLEQAPFYSHGCLTEDLDRDGWPDLIVTGYGGVRIYLNQLSDGDRRTFVDATRQWGVPETTWATSAACGDLFGEGRADLYVCQYLDWTPERDPPCPRRDDPSGRDVCPPQRFQPLPHRLFRNTGERFAEVSDQVGILPGKGLGVVIADLNADRRPDVYVANDDGENRLYLNQGAGRLLENAQAAGVAVDESGRYNGSMGVDAGDFDGSGRPSLLATNYQGELPALYANLGDGLFLYQSQSAGLNAPGLEFVGFGTSFVDLDNDSWLDLVAVNGHVLRHPVGASFRQRGLLFHNQSRGTRRVFQEMTLAPDSPLASPALGRGLAVGDLDNDGWPDLVLSPSNQPVAVLRNTAPRGNDRRWLGLQLTGRANRPIAGACVVVQFEDRQITRFAKSGGSYLSSSDPRLLFGLPGATKIQQVQVHWPWGDVQTWDGALFSLDQYWRLDEQQPAPTRAVAPR